MIRQVSLKKVCLNMIVKNESKVIRRCLESVKPYIDYYVISDTGSTDNTCVIIKDILKGIEGEVYHDEWVDFGHNRTLALQRVPKECTYSLFIDADDELVVTPPYKPIDVKMWLMSNDVSSDLYYIFKSNEGVMSVAPFLVRTLKEGWRWVGKAHNQLHCDDEEVIHSRNEISYNIMTIKVNQMQGAKSHGLSSREKYMRDALLLRESEETLINTFHLAQSYFDAEEYELAYETYSRLKEGDPQFIYYSKFRVGVCAIRLGRPFEECKRLLLEAHIFRPTRIEALFELIKLCHDLGKYKEGYEYGLQALRLSVSDDTLKVDHRIYNHHLYDKFAICAYHIGKYKESRDALQTILDKGWCRDEGVLTTYKKYIKYLDES